MNCPCGTEVKLVAHIFGEGLMDGRGNVARVTRIFRHATYFSDPIFGGTDTGFCSAPCMMKWYERFWRPYRAHLGLAA